MMPLKTADVGLRQRMLTCAKKAGSKRNLAKLSGISEPQLARYLKGTQDPPFRKILQLADAAQVTPEWLLSGQPNQHALPEVGYELNRELSNELVKLIQCLNETEAEMASPPSARRKTEIIPLLLAAGMAQQKQGLPTPYHSIETLSKALYFLEAFPTQQELAAYREAIVALSHKPAVVTEQPLSFFCNAVVRGNKHCYESHYGHAYYERVGYQVRPELQSILNTFLADITKHNSAPKILDLGCGNGRHLKYLHQNCPTAEVTGIENSRLALSYASRAEASNAIPANTIINGDVRQLPFSAETFSGVFSHGVLMYLPYFAKRMVGAIEVLKECQRVLKPAGQLSLICRYGEGIEFAPFEQGYTPETLRSLAEDAGFKVISLTRQAYQETLVGDDPDNKKYLNVCWLRAIKA